MTSIDASILYAEALHRTRTLDKLQALLAAHAPSWSAAMHASEASGATVIAVALTGEIRKAANRQARARGPTYERLINVLGSVPFERASGTLELTGAYPSLALYLSVDDYLLAPSGGSYRWGNRIGIQVRDDAIESTPAVEWLADFFEAICLGTSPVYGYAASSQEWAAQNLDTSAGFEAIGTDVSRALPGLYWLNYFGEPYRDLIDKRALGGVPVERAEDVGGGVLIQLQRNPDDWESRGYQVVARAVRDALGDNLFFDRHNRARATRAPRFAELFGSRTVESGRQTAVFARPLPDRA